LKASGAAVKINSASTGSSEFTLSGISFPPEPLRWTECQLHREIQTRFEWDSLG
jgi:hypothetical protein